MQNLLISDLFFVCCTDFYLFVPLSLFVCVGFIGALKSIIITLKAECLMEAQHILGPTSVLALCCLAAIVGRDLDAGDGLDCSSLVLCVLLSSNFICSSLRLFLCLHVCPDTAVCAHLALMDECILYQPGLGHQSVGQRSAVSSLSHSSADLHIFPLTPPP